MDLSKNKTALAVCIVATGIVTTATLVAIAWPALVRPDPPSEASGDGGLRIRVVEPPKASAPRGDPLDVGLPEAAQAMAKGREALFVATPPVRPPPIRSAPRQVAQLEEQEEEEVDAAPPPEPVDDQWERPRWREDRFERAQRLRSEEEDRLERQERDRQRWDDARDDRYAPPPMPDEDRAPPPGRW